MTKQLNLVQHTSNLFYTAPDALLAERLCQITGYSKVFFGNSGAEANEGAIKLARKYGIEHKGEHCNQIITLRNSFHGRTVTTLAATGQDAFHQHFFPFTEGFRYVEANNQQQLLETLDDSVCSIMIELVQGEGGVIALDKDYVTYIDQLCQDRGILLIVDEVQTGIGRTGTLLCCEQYNIRPDIITLAKGLGAGLPIGAVLMNEKTSEVFQPGHHGTTYGGNPIACAGAIEVLNQVCDENFLPDVTVKAAHIYHRLLSMPNVTGVSGLGLMIGIEIAEGLDSRKIAVQCAENGLIILTAKAKLRMLPPLNITLKEIDKGLDILFQCLSNQ
ncbi:aminotransferase class III-fold pyridoxal phosphate-dependent enzyme [Flintibacter muris]|uniref:aminotransferase class III-fold pyridoxal phosphate-dependent enzyme n=1 Tax=Flintibacter muris TaxID=2941327 RepID=UPI0030B9CD8C